MRILVAADSFKDALGAPGVCAAIAAGLRARWPDAVIEQFPLSDGGEGALDVLAGTLGLQTIEIDAVDPLARPLRARYGLNRRSGLAVIETARACGLELLSSGERDPLATTTYGAGLLLADAIARGARRIVMAVGGSATSDAGIGLAVALGWRILDSEGLDLAPIGANMIRVARLVRPTRTHNIAIEVMCDVDNPLYGPRGAAFVYGAQKGADAAAIVRLDAGLRRIDALIGQDGWAERPGAGAAGGLGFGAMAFADATLAPGADLAMTLTGFDAALAQADLVVTGEGRLDGQTLHGKLIAALCRRAALAGAPVIALCGSVAARAEDLAAIGLAAAIDINRQPAPLNAKLARTRENLERAAQFLELSDVPTASRR